MTNEEFKITPDEVEKLIKIEKLTNGAKYSTPKTTDTKSCSYLLPCGMCDKTDKMCNLIDCII